MDRRRFLSASGLVAAALVAGPADALGRPRRRVPTPTASLVTRWDTDTWSRGSYSSLPAGTSPAVRRTLADAILGGRIALAGEYASTAYPSTTTGAYLSGQHAARRLLDLVNARTAIVVGAGIAGLRGALAMPLGRIAQAFVAREDLALAAGVSGQGARERK